MSRRLVLGVLLAGGVAHAQPLPDTPPPPQGEPFRPTQPPPPLPPTDDQPTQTPAPAAPETPTPIVATQPASDDDAIGDQLIGAEAGMAAGGRVTPGGLRVVGHYLYQLNDRDWFDGGAAFTFGAGGAGCFRDRMNARICDHGLADGAGFELSANVRRVFTPQGMFRPYARVGIGAGYVRYSDDDVSGLVFPLHLGGGIRGRVSPTIAVVAEAELQLGFGRFGNGVGMQPLLGLTVTAGAEFRLK